MQKRVFNPYALKNNMLRAIKTTEGFDDDYTYITIGDAKMILALIAEVEECRRKEENKPVTVKKYHGKTQIEMFGVLNILLDLERQVGLSKEEEQALDIAIHCVTTIANRMSEDKPIDWDEQPTDKN